MVCIIFFFLLSLCWFFSLCVYSFSPYYLMHYFHPFFFSEKITLKVYNFSYKCYFRCTYMFWLVAFLLALSSVHFTIFTFISSVRLMACLEYFKVSRYVARVKTSIIFYLQNSSSGNPRGLLPCQIFVPHSPSQELVYILLNWIFHRSVVILFISNNGFRLKVYFIHFID